MDLAMKYAAGLMFAVLATLVPAAVSAADDPAKGKQQFAKCGMCHTLEPGKTTIGPSLAGIVGRKSASQAGYNYSKAMQALGIVWTPQNIDKYITNPRAMVPGGKMVFAGLPKPEDRANLIAYLKKP